MLSSLPPELIYLILAFLIPPKHRLYSNEASRDLLSLTLVCQATYPIAVELLLRNFVYLKSGKAIDLLVNGPLCKDSRYAKTKGGRVLFPSQAHIQITKHQYRTSTLPPIRGLPIPEMKPLVVPEHRYEQHINAFDTLFSRVGCCLTRLVLNSDFHVQSGTPTGIMMDGRDLVGKYEPLTAKEIRVREAFKQLTVLEEFCNIRIDRYSSCPTSTTDLPIWTYFHNLRRLALTGIKVNSRIFIQGLASLQKLECLLLVCPDSVAMSAKIPEDYFPTSFNVQQITVIPKWYEWRFPLVTDWVVQGTFLAQIHHRMQERKNYPARISIIHRHVWVLPLDCQHFLSKGEKWLSHMAKYEDLWHLEDHGKSKIYLQL